MTDWLNNLNPTAQFALFTAVKVIAAFSVMMFIVAYIVLVERRVCAFIQDRLGPNRVGPFGLLQPAADAVKAFFKEEITPAHVRRVFYVLAPMIALIPAILNLAVIPFGSTLGKQHMVLADLNVGILYTFGIVSLGVYSIVLAGYAANSKYPFLGGIRSSAQMISYEISMGMSVIPVFLCVGSLNLSDVIQSQTGTAAWLPLLPNWFVFQSPMTFLAFCIFLGASFAETNRTPFDLPEAEQELAGGYNVEYSSMKFAMFFMGEYANMILASGHDGDVVLRRLDVAVVWSRPTCVVAARRRVAHRNFPREGPGLPRPVHLGALDVAAFPVRPVDEFGLAAVHPDCPGKHCGNRCVALVED